MIAKTMYYFGLYIYFTVEITTSPVTESSQGYWNFTGIKPNLPENVTFNIFSGTYTYVCVYIRTLWNIVLY